MKLSMATPDASFLARLLSRPTSESAVELLASKSRCTRSQRRRLATLAGLESAWRECDQSIPGNVEDLAKMIVKELHEPYRFYRNSLSGDGEEGGDPRSMFEGRLATPPLRYADKFWTARSGTGTCPWLPTSASASTFDAVVHFVQASSGTGVHIGDGRILTCAHVVEARDDHAKADEDESYLPDRVGRRKIVMFPSGRTFVAECRVVSESSDGAKDVALLVLGAELDLIQVRSNVGDAKLPLPPAATVADEAPSRGSRMFCIGNPSNVDLESHGEEDLDLDPPAWHASSGACLGYLDPSAHRTNLEQDAIGRALTKEERRARRKPKLVDAQKGALMLHSCWTYWGHSGAPLFDDRGRIAGLHCAWDDRTGVRHGQKLQVLREVVAGYDRTTGGACGGSQKTAKRRRRA